jgi:hypothetical protein
VEAQPGALEGGACKGGGVRLGEAERRKGGNAREELFGVGARCANGCHCPVDEARA